MELKWTLAKLTAARLPLTGQSKKQHQKLAASSCRPVEVAVSRKSVVLVVVVVVVCIYIVQTNINCNLLQFSEIGENERAAIVWWWLKQQQQQQQQSFDGYQCLWGCKAEENALLRKL